ncbi:hypothetical protein [Candidatus Uabimicrobium sp. HlEnr_7]|uniref:hypothetical protein n=1 Tax=Candidatus Uabimicrobium helgolandensis TaxID=3095367 RepID=UPI00355826D9
MKNFIIGTVIILTIFLLWFTKYIWNNRLYYSKVASVRTDSGIYDIAIVTYYIKFRTMPRTINDLFDQEYHDVKKLLRRNDRWEIVIVILIKEKIFK